MRTLKRWSEYMSALAIMAIAVTGIGKLALAATESHQLMKLAQSSLIGQCRAAVHPTPIFSQSNASSPVIHLLTTNQQVTLAENVKSDAPFILVSAPSKGYVFTKNLKLCGGKDPRPCRQVLRPTSGLAIHTEPNLDSAQTNPPGVAQFQPVYLTTNPPTAQKDRAGRIWVQIAQPAKGWISNGYLGTSNLGGCP